MNCRPCMVPGTPPREKSAGARLSAEKNPGFCPAQPRDAPCISAARMVK